MNTHNKQAQEFWQGFADGAGVAGINMHRAYRIIEDILGTKDSCWHKLLAEIEPSKRAYFGHQLACLMASVKRGHDNDALANFFRAVDAAIAGTKHFKLN